uniref:Non-specific lipid-transfer protein n=1 Tax=Vitis cinerea var. helleri x Vitis vinifera TaxID=152273 RepID=Q850K8_9ROSI|nr:nonspecific lipid transfer protein 1 [Vitis cinerea var. helleri x Vitis vinifera]
MGSSGAVKLACVMVICMVVAAPAAVEAAITCGQVSSALSSCLGYLKNGGAVPPGCCSGIKNLNSAAQTTADRQAACKCLKTFSNSIPGINLGLASGLPGKCGVSVPYKISPSTDCSKVT